MSKSWLAFNNNEKKTWNGTDLFPSLSTISPHFFSLHKTFGVIFFYVVLLPHTLVLNELAGHETDTIRRCAKGGPSKKYQQHVSVRTRSQKLMKIRDSSFNYDKKKHYSTSEKRWKSIREKEEKEGGGELKPYSYTQTLKTAKKWQQQRKGFRGGAKN